MVFLVIYMDSKVVLGLGKDAVNMFLRIFGVFGYCVNGVKKDIIGIKEKMKGFFFR